MPLPIVRPRNAAATREAILASARRKFLADSYDSVSLRDIAGDAGVDVALIGRYFGGKEILFRQVLESGAPSRLRALTGSETLPEFLVDLVTRPHSHDPNRNPDHDRDHREHAERLILILRSASSPVAAEIVRKAFTQDVLGPLARLLDGPDSEIRASLALAVLIGTRLLDTIMGVGPLCHADCQPVRGRLVRLLETALAADE